MSICEITQEPNYYENPWCQVEGNAGGQWHGRNKPVVARVSNQWGLLVPKNACCLHIENQKCPDWKMYNELIHSEWVLLYLAKSEGPRIGSYAAI